MSGNYRIAFVRVGRSHQVAPLTVSADLSDGEVVDRITAYIRPLLASNMFDVNVTFPEGQQVGKLLIEGGRYGEGIITIDEGAAQ